MWEWTHFSIFSFRLIINFPLAFLFIYPIYFGTPLIHQGLCCFIIDMIWIEKRFSEHVYIEPNDEQNWSTKRLWKSFSVNDFPTVEMQKSRRWNAVKVVSLRRSLDILSRRKLKENKRTSVRNINNRNHVLLSFRFYSPFLSGWALGY